MAYSLPHLFAAGGRVYFVTGTKTQTGGQTDRKGNKTPVYSWRPRFVGLDIAGGKEVWRCQDEALGEMAWIGLYADCPDGGVLLGFDEGGYLGVSVVGQAKPWYLRVRTQSKGKGEDKPFADLRRAFGCLACAGGLLWVRDSLGTLWGDQQTPTSPGDVQVIGWRGIDPRTGKPGPRIGYPLMRPWGGIHPRSGQFVASLDMAVERNWSGRCYVDVAGRNCILSQTMEIVGLDGKHLEHVHGIRGQCGIGFILGNNSLYTPPNQCIGCYPMVRGAVAYETSQATRGAAVADDARLEKGPAYGQTDNRQPPVDSSRDWPMFRHDPLRTGCTPLKLPPGGVKLKWTAQVGSRCTQPVVAGGRAVTAVVGEGRVVCLDAAAGKTLWDFAAGSRIDSSPTLCGDLVLFGCHDGYLYCLRAGDGALAWRFNAAAAHRRIVVNDRVESPWPVFGSVLACDGAVFAMAGQYSALDGGLRFWGLEAATGKVRFGRVFAGIKGEKAVILPTFWYTHQEQGLNNILVADKGRIRLYEEWGRLGVQLRRRAHAGPAPGRAAARLAAGPHHARRPQHRGPLAVGGLRPRLAAVPHAGRALHAPAVAGAGPAHALQRAGGQLHVLPRQARAGRLPAGQGRRHRGRARAVGPAHRTEDHRLAEPVRQVPRPRGGQGQALGDADAAHRRAVVRDGGQGDAVAGGHRPAAGGERDRRPGRRASPRRQARRAAAVQRARRPFDGRRHRAGSLDVRRRGHVRRHVRRGRTPLRRHPRRARAVLRQMTAQRRAWGRATPARPAPGIAQLTTVFSA